MLKLEPIHLEKEYLRHFTVKVSCESVNCCGDRLVGITNT